MTEKLKEVSSIATTDNYAELISLAVPAQVTGLLISLKELNTNAVLYKIQGSNDPDFTVAEDLKGETALAKNGSVYETVAEPWLHVRVLVKAAVAESQGSVSCVISGS